MPKISELPDFSRFIRRDDKVMIYNNVHFVVGETIIEANGLVVSQESSVLLDLVAKNTEIYLDDFINDVDGVQDCLEFLYGAEVELNTDNIQSIIKFSIKFEIESLYKISIQWITDKIFDLDDLYMFLNIGLMAQSMHEDKKDILDVCHERIKCDFKDVLVVTWPLEDTCFNVIKFLMQKDLLQYTLSIIIAWVQNDSHIKLILDHAEDKDITEELFGRGDDSIELARVMSDKVENVETSRKVIRLASTGFKVISGSEQKKCLKDLIFDEYSSFSVGRIIDTEELYALEHHAFVEIAADWIVKKRPRVSQNDLAALSSRIKPKELNKIYMTYVQKMISWNSGNVIPGVTDLSEDKYGYSRAVWCICRSRDSHSMLTDDQLSCLLKMDFFTLKLKCKQCDNMGWAKVKLSDGVPCYEIYKYSTLNEHCIVKHWTLEWFYRGSYQQFSLITNRTSDVIEKIKKCQLNDISMYLSCLYRCKKKEAPTSQWCQGA